MPGQERCFWTSRPSTMHTPAQPIRCSPLFADKGERRSRGIAMLTQLQGTERCKREGGWKGRWIKRRMQQQPASGAHPTVLYLNIILPPTGEVTERLGAAVMVTAPPSEKSLRDHVGCILAHCRDTSWRSRVALVCRARKSPTPPPPTNNHR